MPRAPHSLPLYIGDMPPTVRQMLTILPTSAVMRMVREMHGERLYFRARINDVTSHPAYARIMPVIGDQHARTLVNAWRGDILEVPNCAQALARANARWLRAQYDAGVPIHELCRATGYSRRWIFELLKRSDPAP